MSDMRVRMTIESFEQDVDDKGYVRENRKQTVIVVTVVDCYQGYENLSKHLNHLVEAAKSENFVTQTKGLEWKPTPSS